MKSLLLLRNITVENANAISGITWGFPGISNFLGYVHALSRYLDTQRGLKLGGCGLICHRHQVHAHQPGGWEWKFSLTRNPLTREGKTAPFNEEGRMNFRASLLIECDFTADELLSEGSTPESAIVQFKRMVMEQAMRQRLAGGTVLEIEGVEWLELNPDSEAGEKRTRHLMLSLLPGYALICRHDVLVSHHQHRQSQNASAELLDSLLDFVALQYQAVEPAEGSDNEAVTWSILPKPASGYLVPISVGYQGISSIYDRGEVARSRDPDTPFRFVESIYTLGEWRSPHRIRRLDEMLWRYDHVDDLYLCRNGSAPTETEVFEFNF
ncbi:type I-F CRISPR-associated protein Csy2 [Marinobacterium nitratireducens]|uniref:Type I-F CRISPR-associated protein Csy2 n=1 Tax=Marinobacterium nitratireducens TaxID=518897 RepID=A0A917ZBA8_9GAMM|nr:type I-F CRISPR-associated protein Csy2 [Marinobacterium nitratireducens]GGO80058.1 type I-F CRISPR-associated protein Csy2 [Marinobacterium nitratireducens]